MNPTMQEKLQRLKAFRSNLTTENAYRLTTLIAEIKQELPEKYRIKLSVLKFFENYEEPTAVDDLPF